MKPTNIKKDYFHGIGKMVAKELGCSADYVRNVLNGLYGDRDTLLIRDIRRVADRIAEGVKPNNNESQVNAA